MKVLITGDKIIVKYDIIKDIIDNSKINISELVSDGIKGICTLAENYAVQKNINIKRMKPNYSHGISCIEINRMKMLDYSDAIIAIWDGESKGTKDMIEYATKKGLSLHIYKVKPNGEWHVATSC